MYLRRLSTMRKFPITISTNAWDKMTHILEKSNEYAFVFFATGGEDAMGLIINLNPLMRKNLII